jgi:DNA mismatch repair protein MutH
MPAQFDQASPADIERYGRRLLKKTLRMQPGVKSIPVEYLKVAVGSKTKGTFGKLLENYYYGITPGNDSAPDFPEAGVELKSTALKRLSRGGYSAKERLVLGLINYKKEAEAADFDSSSFLRKNAKIMLVSYEYRQNRAAVDHPVQVAQLLEFNQLPVKDQMIIRNDWERIIAKVKAGKAHELSEGDTDYLAACTKASDGSKLRTQVGDIQAKPRAYSFKAGYMTVLLRQMFSPEKAAAEYEEAVDVKDLQRKTLEQEILDRFAPFIGRYTEDICAEIAPELGNKAKDFVALLARRMIGVKGRKIEEFEKAEVQMKIVQLNKNGMPTQDMSFPAMRFNELLQEDWDAADDDDDRRPSTFKGQLHKRSLIVVYQCDGDGKKADRRKLAKAFFWTMPEETIETEVRKVWNAMVAAVRASDKAGFPKISQNPVSHVRPHGRARKDVDTLPDGTTATKQAFWLNKGYIRRVIEGAD